MSWTIEDLEALEQAIKRGESKVRFKDSEVTYYGLNQMLKLRELMKRELGISKKTRRVNPTYSKGLE